MAMRNINTSAVAMSTTIATPVAVTRRRVKLVNIGCFALAYILNPRANSSCQSDEFRLAIVKGWTIVVDVNRSKIVPKRLVIILETFQDGG